MLVVCFTNHALDQFLGGVLVDLIEDGRYNDELPSIIRFGSRCKSETLQRYVIFLFHFESENDFAEIAL